MEKLQGRLEAWGKARSRGLPRYLIVHGALPWGLLPGLFFDVAMSLLFQFEIFSLQGFFRLLSCLLFFSYCGMYFAWHRWRTEEYIWESSIETAQGAKAPAPASHSHSHSQQPESPRF